MRRALPLPFLHFYVASSYVFTQERTGFDVNRVPQWLTRTGQVQAEKNHTQVADGSPNYREAKPNQGYAVYLRQLEWVHYLLHDFERSFPQMHSFKPAQSADIISLRAPAVHVQPLLNTTETNMGWGTSALGLASAKSS